jgi:hypothetical protein
VDGVWILLEETTTTTTTSNNRMTSWANQPLFGDDHQESYFGMSSKMTRNIATVLVMFIPILFSSKARRFLQARYARYDLYLKFQLSKKWETKNKKGTIVAGAGQSSVQVSDILVYPGRYAKWEESCMTVVLLCLYRQLVS